MHTVSVFGVCLLGQLLSTCVCGNASANETAGSSDIEVQARESDMTYSNLTIVNYFNETSGQVISNVQWKLSNNVNSSQVKANFIPVTGCSGRYRVLVSNTQAVITIDDFIGRNYTYSGCQAFISLYAPGSQSRPIAVPLDINCETVQGFTCPPVTEVIPGPWCLPTRVTSTLLDDSPNLVYISWIYPNEGPYFPKKPIKHQVVRYGFIPDKFGSLFQGIIELGKVDLDGQARDVILSNQKFDVDKLHFVQVCAYFTDDKEQHPLEMEWSAMGGFYLEIGNSGGGDKKP